MSARAHAAAHSCSIATADKMALVLMRPLVDVYLTLRVFAFYTGTVFNYVMCYVFWHAYWWMEAAYIPPHQRRRQSARTSIAHV